jgi:hypothetical protein
MEKIIVKIETDKGISDKERKHSAIVDTPYRNNDIMNNRKNNSLRGTVAHKRDTRKEGD